MSKLNEPKQVLNILFSEAEIRRRMLVLILLCIFATPSFPQEFKPYPHANISKSQWQTYFNEVKEKHGTTVQDIEAENLLVFTDKSSGTIFGFTKSGHPAHPAWIARKPEQRGDSMFIGQIGYFAGDEPAFAKLWKEYLALNEKVIEDAKRKQQAEVKSSATGKLQLTHVRSALNQDKEWAPTDRQTVALERAVLEYFEHLDSSRFSEMYELFTPEVKRMIPPEQYVREQVETKRTSGALKGRRIASVTWYKDAQGFIGVFAAVDHSSDYENLALHCGFVIMSERQDGHYSVQRTEVNRVDRQTAKDMSKERLDDFRKTYGCK
jgi:hypothetical protein